MTEYRHIQIELVAQAHNNLIRLRGKVHAQLTGYLAALADAQGDYTKVVETTAIESFFKRFFAPKNATSDRPYYVPWTRNAPGWLKPNLQGSYAPSSSRHGMPDVMIAVTDGARGWRFQTDHAQKCLDKLLQGNRLSGYDLAIFILREAGFGVDAKPEDIKEEFRRIMGFLQGEGSIVEKVLIEWGRTPVNPFCTHENESRA